MRGIVRAEGCPAKQDALGKTEDLAAQRTPLGMS